MGRGGEEWKEVIPGLGGVPGGESSAGVVLCQGVGSLKARAYKIALELPHGSVAFLCLDRWRCVDGSLPRLSAARRLLDHTPLGTWW